MAMAQYMQYGCGFSAPSGWLNFDASPTLRFERLPVVGHMYSKNKARFPPNVRYGDITKGLPVGSGSCRGIYCSHILEHLTRQDCEKALRSTLDYLEPGGVFRLVVPDLKKIAKDYVANDSEEAAHVFMAASTLGEERRSRGLMALLSRSFGNARHLWMWDEKSMIRQLEEAGFHSVRRCEFNDCADPKFREVEQEDRFRDCLAVEALK